MSQSKLEVGALAVYRSVYEYGPSGHSEHGSTVSKKSACKFRPVPLTPTLTPQHTHTQRWAVLAHNEDLSRILKDNGVSTCALPTRVWVRSGWRARVGSARASEGRELVSVCAWPRPPLPLRRGVQSSPRLTLQLAPTFPIHSSPLSCSPRSGPSPQGALASHLRAWTTTRRLRCASRSCGSGPPSRWP